MEITKRHLLYWRLKNQFMLFRGGRMELVSKLLGLQAQFANNPKYALRIRASDFDEETWSAGLIKTWTFRHTLHVIPEAELGLYLSAQNEIGEGGAWTDAWGMKADRIESVAGFLMEKIRAGVSTRAALKEQCRAAGFSPEEMSSAFNGWGGIFSEMFKRGLIVYHAGGEKRFALCGGARRLDRDAARMELVRRYFAAFGPATKADCVIFMGGQFLSRPAILRAIEEAGLSPVFCEGEEYLYSGGVPEEKAVPECLFLAGFDHLIMGYRNTSRTYILDKKFYHDIVTPQGIVFPTVLLEGRIRARWKMGNPILITPLDAIPPGKKRLIQKTGEDLFGCETAFQ